MIDLCLPLNRVEPGLKNLFLFGLFKYLIVVVLQIKKVNLGFLDAPKSSGFRDRVESSGAVLFNKYTVEFLGPMKV